MAKTWGLERLVVIGDVVVPRLGSNPRHWY